MKYQKAGVDIKGSVRVKKEIKKLAERTYTKNILAGVGSFGAMYDLGEEKVLVFSVDGVGTKLEIAQAMGDCRIIGTDVVNHGINDILCSGARPEFFVDYIAQDKLREKEVLQIVEGMVSACLEAGIALPGGELAQMPGFYLEGKGDVVGFIAGIVERGQIIDGKKIRPGDILLGLPSTGPHTNGYSLVRDIFYQKFNWLGPYIWHYYLDQLGETLGSALLKPHRSYLQPITLILNKGFEIHGIAHITGGGLPGNIVRILPENCQARIYLGSWPILPIFQYIQKKGNVSTEEMHQVFNGGIGIVLIVSREKTKKISKILWAHGEPCYQIGKIISGAREVKLYNKGRKPLPF